MAKPIKLIELANEEASVLGHDYIGTEHLLLDLTRQGGTVAAGALTARGVQREALQAVITRIVHAGPCEHRDRRPFTPRAKRAVEFAIDEARALGHNYVGSEHLLLGLLRIVDGVGIQALCGLGADLEAIRRAVHEGLKQA